ncbi:MAG TPA: ShlB/FhaC/HecB family hemolysin secretion/activation protein, partial [Candidatus Paceibacterota bacterium]|nr:ShlB/FhaC/HecB family hemolysin secretion/activation protein [Candidatus Paceibacterota bacterium]
GVQYGFSPQDYKQGDMWNFYDKPLVANYSGFYRLPLGNPQPIEDTIANNPGSFGYDEATHKFNLPPPSGRSDLTIYGSRSTIDNGLEKDPLIDLSPSPTNSLQINRQDVYESLTVNQNIGTRLNIPLAAPDNVQLNFSGGLDYKTYQVRTTKTNLFLFSQVIYNGVTGNPDSTNNSTIASPVPATIQQIQYLPLSFRADANWRDSAGSTSLGLGLSVNPWYSSQTYVTSTSTDTNGVSTTTTTKTYGSSSLQNITGSAKSTGYWVVLNPSYERTFIFRTNWVTSFRLDGQWASQPLISNERFGIGGVNSVRGYHEGEAFGDTGWHMSLEQQTPPHLVGMVHGNVPLTLRGSVYMDFAAAYQLDPQGGPVSTRLWGTGFGIAASLGSHWQANFLISVPLISTSFTPRDEPYFNFSMTSQF